MLLANASMYEDGPAEKIGWGYWERWGMVQSRDGRRGVVIVALGGAGYPASRWVEGVDVHASDADVVDAVDIVVGVVGIEADAADAQIDVLDMAGVCDGGVDLVHVAAPVADADDVVGVVEVVVLVVAAAAAVFVVVTAAALAVITY